MTTDNIAIANLANILFKKGVRTVIISPGSRNAPLVLAFNRHKNLECLSIIDERCAAFFALGMAQQSRIPTVVVSTSGTAALNFAPAIAEAFYQEIPLIVITADRPVEFIDQAEGQSIRQKNIFSNYVKTSFELPQKASTSDDIWYNDRIISEAFNSSVSGKKGPVHINIPFCEPLYNHTENIAFHSKIIEIENTLPSLSKSTIEKLLAEWNSFSKKMILTGMLEPDVEINKRLNEISNENNLIVLTETTSNLNGENFFPCIDKVITSFSDDESKSFSADLLVTFGNQIISKKIKSFLRNHAPKAHWHISNSATAPDTFKSLTKIIPVHPAEFLKLIYSSEKKYVNDFKTRWQERKIKTENLHQQYISSCPFSDLKVYEYILNSIPDHSNLQMANSSGVRYVQLFEAFKKLSYNANRGTSGIDGCTSTASGAAYFSKKPTTLVTGDIAFFYDSNALWNNNLPNNLKIIIINNSGGGIFRIIPGSSEVEELEEFFATKHNLTAEHIAKNFNIDYNLCDNEKELKNKLKQLYADENKISILEIITPAKESAEIIKAYFKYLKQE